MIRINSIIFVIICNSAIYANGNTLSVGNLEASIEKCYPKILNAAIQQEINTANVTKSQSPFDTRINADSLGRQGSTYNTGYQRIALEKRFFSSPISVYTGYDISTGYTPQYDSAQITSTAGRQFLGLKMNLLNGFSVDEERIKVYNALLEKDKSNYELQLSQLMVKTEAIKAYLDWWLSGTQLKIYENLLSISEKRQTALEKRFKHGDIAEISVKENKNNVLKRKIRVTKAADNYNKSAQYLSLYYRDYSCNTVLPSIDMLPKKIPKVQTLPRSPIIDEVNKAANNRPEFKIIQTQINQILNQQQLAKTNLLPKLNLSLQYNQNNSDTATSSYFKLNQNEVVAKLEFSMPLDRSYGKGMNKEADANYRKLINDRQLLTDQLKSQIETLHFSTNATHEQVEFSKAENDISHDLLAAENTQLNSGNSNFFMLNLREDNAVTSYLNYIDKIAENYSAVIQYNFLMGKNIKLASTYPDLSK